MILSSERRLRSGIGVKEELYQITYFINLELIKMKKLIYVALVLFTMVALNSCNKVENPLSEQSPVMQTDGQGTRYSLRMVISKDDGETITILIDNTYNTRGYTTGPWTSFYTGDDDGSHNVECSLTWDGGGTSIYDVGLYLIKNSSNTIIFTRSLNCDTSYSGYRNSSFSVNLNSNEQYWLSMATTVVTEDENKND